PLPEALHLEVQVDAVDGRGQVGLDRAAALPLAEHLVLVLDQPRLDDRGEVLGVRPPQAAPRAHPADHPLDDRKLLQEPLLVSHLARFGDLRDGDAAPAIPPLVRMIRPKAESGAGLDPHGASLIDVWETRCKRYKGAP